MRAAGCLGVDSMGQRIGGGGGGATAAERGGGAQPHMASHSRRAMLCAPAEGDGAKKARTSSPVATCLVTPLPAPPCQQMNGSPSLLRSIVMPAQWNRRGRPSGGMVTPSRRQALETATVQTTSRANCRQFGSALIAAPAQGAPAQPTGTGRGGCETDRPPTRRRRLPPARAAPRGGHSCWCWLFACVAAVDGAVGGQGRALDGVVLRWS